MREIVIGDAQNTLANTFASRWVVEHTPATLLRASANFVYWFKAEGQTLILRFNLASERPHDLLMGEVEYLQLLTLRGPFVASPIASLQLQWIETVSTPHGNFHGVVFAALPGEHPDSADLTREQFQQWGQTLGHLHQMALLHESFHTIGGRPTWQDHLAQIAAHLPADEEVAHRVLTRVTSQLEALPIRDDNFGLIHYDFELDNLLFHEGRISIIDFDEASWYWFAADVAYALRDLFDDDPDQIELTHPSLQAFVQGYRQKHTLSDEDLTHLPLFLRLHNLRLFTQVLRSLGTGARPDDPRWMHNLRARLTQIADEYRAGFVRSNL